MNRGRFEQLVQEALTTIPRSFRRRMENLAVIVEDAPSADLLRELDIGPSDTLFGIYHGVPLPERSWDFGNRLPDQITIFQHPIEES